MSIVLSSIKKVSGIVESDTSFDEDLLLYTNTTISILSQLGLTVVDNLPIIDKTNTWEELLGISTDLEFVKTYMGLKVKMLFDPPTNTAAIEAINSMINELEWRITNLPTILKRLG